MECRPDLATLLEAELVKTGQRVVGKAVDNDDLFQLKCKSDSSNYIIKLQKVGNIDSGEKEPVVGLTILIGDDGNYLEMAQIYRNLLNHLNQTGQEILGLVVQKQATIRKNVGPFRDKPAFQYLWETVLAQQGNTLQNFGPSIQGGGIRIVAGPQIIPASAEEQQSPSDQPHGIENSLQAEIVQAEHRVESLLKDPRYLLVQSAYHFLQPAHYSRIDGLIMATDRNIKHIIEDAEKVAAGFLNHGGADE
jgi:hypothetical protein